VFYHISMIVGSNHEKLSKRHGAVSVLEFKKDGYLPDPFINHLALLGWAPADGVEIINRQHLKKQFSHAKFNPSPAVFDYNKLNFLNAHFIRNTDIEILFPYFYPYLKAAKYLNENASVDEIDRIKKITAVTKHYCKKLPDINTHIAVFLKDEVPFKKDDFNKLKNENKKKIYHFCHDILVLSDKEFITDDEIKSLHKAAKNTLGVSTKDFYMSLRFILTGSEHGLEMQQIFEILKRNSVLKRLKRGFS